MDDAVNADMVLNTHCIDWNPFVAMCVGDARVPGPSDDRAATSDLHNMDKHLRLRLLNVRGGGRLKADLIAQHKADFTACTELELLEAAVVDFRQTCRDNGKVATLGEPANISKQSSRIRGRRVGIISRHARLDCPASHPADGLDELRRSGRWIEVIIPVGEGNKLCTLACFYGIAGASSGGDECVVNERLLAAALSRACAAGDAPYLLCMDGNISAKASAIITAVTNDAALIDLRADRDPVNASQPTFKFGGIKATPLTEGEVGTSAIDFWFANEAANCLVSAVQVRWDLCEGCDHVPMDVLLNIEAYNDIIDVVEKPSQITTANLVKLDDDTLNDLYCRVRTEGAKHFERLCSTCNPTVAHRQWSILCEVFLHAWQTIGDPKDRAQIDNAVNYASAHFEAHDLLTSNSTSHSGASTWPSPSFAVAASLPPARDARHGLASTGVFEARRLYHSSLPPLCRGEQLQTRSTLAVKNTEKGSIRAS